MRMTLAGKFNIFLDLFRHCDDGTGTEKEPTRVPNQTHQRWIDEFGPARERWEEVIFGEKPSIKRCVFFLERIDLDDIHISAYDYPIDGKGGGILHRLLLVPSCMKVWVSSPRLRMCISTRMIFKLGSNVDEDGNS
jgi:hypothetical protein